MMARSRAGRSQEIEAFIRFEEAMMDFLFDNGHLSRALRPLWIERLNARRTVPGDEALATHRLAARDCLEMARPWSPGEVAAADRFFASRHAPTLSDMRRQLHWSATGGRRHT